MIFFALEKRGLYFYYFDEKKKKLENIKKVNRDDLFENGFHIVNITNPKFSKKNNNFEFCKDNNICYNLENFNFEILIKKKKEKRKLKIYLSDILGSKNLSSDKKTILNSKIKNLISLNQINFKIYKSINNSYYKIKDLPQEHKISKKSTNLIYQKKIKNSLFLSFSNNKNIYLHQIFILKELPEIDQNTILRPESIIIKKHTFEIQKLVPYINFEKIQIEIIILYNNYYIIINLKGRIFLFKINFNGIKITCKLKGMHYFNLKCKEKLEISFLNEKNFGKKNWVENHGGNFEKFEVLVEYQVYRIDFDKLWGFLFIAFLIFLVYMVMKRKQERFYTRRFGKGKKKVK